MLTRANFFWPAMWSGFAEPSSSLFADDPKNLHTASSYGMVVSTSHHEPMQRSTQSGAETALARGPGILTRDGSATSLDTESSVQNPMRYRYLYCVYTLGMRGEGDGKIESSAPGDTLKDVIRTQREIIKEAYEKENGTLRKCPLIVTDYSPC